MIAAVVIVSPIAILFTIRLIMFLIETNAVAQGEAIVAVIRFTAAAGWRPLCERDRWTQQNAGQTRPMRRFVVTRSARRHRENGHSIRQTAVGSSPPDSHRRQYPRVRQSASRPPAADRYGSLQTAAHLAKFRRASHHRGQIKAKPSTWHSSTQNRRHWRAYSTTSGWLRLSVFPQPVQL